MTKPKRIYLAGPEVFFPAEEHNASIAEKKRLLREVGCEGVDPLDTALTFSEHDTKPVRGHRISQVNRELMDSCDAIVANLTPFRGISADPGTVFEVWLHGRPGQTRLRIHDGTQALSRTRGRNRSR